MGGCLTGWRRIVAETADTASEMTGLVLSTPGTRKGVVVIRRELDPEGLQKKEGENHEKGGEQQSRLHG